MIVQKDTGAVRITAGLALRVLGTIALLLVVLAIVGQVLKHVMGYDRVGGFVHQFYLSEDNNVATYFSALLTFIAAVLLGFIGQHWIRRVPGRAVQWLSLALVFLALSLEEAVRFSLFVDALLDLAFVEAGLPPSSRLVWGLLAVVLALWYLPLVRSLPPHTRLQFIVAGVLYVFGGLALEYAGRMYGLVHGYVDLPFALISIAEEAVELAGMLLFIYALLEYLAGYVGEVRLRFG